MNPIAKDVPETVVAEAWGKNMLALFRLFGQAPTVDYLKRLSLRAGIQGCLTPFLKACKYSSRRRSGRQPSFKSR